MSLFEIYLASYSPKIFQQLININYVKVEWAIYDNKTVAKVVVVRSRRPAYVEKKDAAFYIRSLNTTTPLNTRQAYDYITDHWKSF